MPAITRDPISLYLQDRVDFRRIADTARDIRKISSTVVATPPAATMTMAPIHRHPLGEERARLHFSFTFASAERKITGSHYARHVGSFMSLSPGPSTFAISPPTFSTTPSPALSLSPSSSTRSRLPSSFATLRPSTSGARRRYYLFRKLTPAKVNVTRKSFVVLHRVSPLLLIGTIHLAKNGLLPFAPS